MGQGGGEAQVAFIFQEDQGALRGREVDPGDAHLGLEKMGLQIGRGLAGQGLGLRRGPESQVLRKDIGDLVAIQVEGRGGEMRRGVAGQLDNELPQVRLQDLKARGGQGRIEADFLGGHGLGFDHRLDPVFPGHVEDKLAGLGGVPGPEHPAAPGGHGPLQVLQELIQPGHGLGFAGPGLTAPGFPEGIVRKAAGPGRPGRDASPPGPPGTSLR